MNSISNHTGKKHEIEAVPLNGVSTTPHVNDHSTEYAPCTKERIMVIDSLPTHRERMRILLEANGYAVFDAKQTEECIWLTQECNPDLILINTNLENGSGFDICRKLVNEPSLKDVPVIFMSDSKDTSDLVCGLECGGKDLIMHPFNPTESIPRIKAHLEIRQLKKQIQGKVENETGDAQKLKEQMGRFVHDLKNPIGAIRGIGELMLEGVVGELSDDQSELLSDILESSESLLKIVNEMAKSKEL